MGCPIRESWHYFLQAARDSPDGRLFHRLFAPARLNITINDRFGHPVQPEEWFLVPLFVIDEAVARIKDGSITGYIYDPSAVKLVKA